MTDTRLLNEIAEDIKQHWYKVSPSAQPYLDAMFHVEYLKDRHRSTGDDGKHIVLRFLSNASLWRGDDARRIKSELREMISEENLIAKVQNKLGEKR